MPSNLQSDLEILRDCSKIKQEADRRLEYDSRSAI